MRYLVIGTSGSGKTAFAHALAQRLAIPHIELDALHWGENWTMRPRDAFIERVREASQPERWVADGNYSVVRDVLWPRATHVVWLDYSRAVVFTRVLRRTVWRTLTREVLWHGNRESVSQAFFSRESILLWAFNTYARNRLRYAALRADDRYARLQWMTFTRPSQAAAFLASQQSPTRP